MDWLIQLKQHAEQLSRSEQTLIDYVNRFPHHALGMTQQDLAEAAGVSKPVVIAASRKLGFASFRDFRAAVEQFFATQIDSLSAARRVHAQVDSLTSLVRTARSVDARAMERLESTMTPQLLEEAVHRFHDARRVWVMGPATGSYPAHYLANRLARYGITTTLVERDERAIPVAIAQVDPRDVLVYFHYSDDDTLLRRTLAAPQVTTVWSLLLSAVIHPLYVGAVGCFAHVPRGELDFKNSMAVPMHAAHLLLLAYEHQFRDEVDAYLSTLESARRVWTDATEQTAFQ